MEESEEIKKAIETLRQKVTDLTDASEQLNEIYLKMINENENELWVEPFDLARLSGTTMNEVNKIIYDFDDFVVNSKGKITSRKKYNAKTSFFQKLKDSSTGLIE